MNRDSIPNDLKQFILERIESVAYLEGLLLLRSKPDALWSCEVVANRLYIGQKQTAELLAGLDADVCDAGKGPKRMSWRVAHLQR